MLRSYSRRCMPVQHRRAGSNRWLATTRRSPPDPIDTLIDRTSLAPSRYPGSQREIIPHTARERKFAIQPIGILSRCRRSPRCSLGAALVTEMKLLPMVWALTRYTLLLFWFQSIRMEVISR
jgi:hypothetical protein